MPNYTCTSCGESFPTLTTKRLHQRDCAAADLDLDVSGMDVDEIVDHAVAELLVCDVCVAKNDGAASIETDHTDAGFGVELVYECAHCGAHNEHEAILA